MNPQWRLYRPAIWLVMIGIAMILLVSPPYLGAVILGGGIGVGIRTGQRRRRRRLTAARGGVLRAGRRGGRGGRGRRRNP